MGASLRLRREVQERQIGWRNCFQVWMSTTGIRDARAKWCELANGIHGSCGSGSKTGASSSAAVGVRSPHWAFELRREVHKLIQLRREVRKRGWFRIHMRREVHELSQRGPRRMSVGV